MRESERARLMRAASIGPKMVEYLELIGVRRLDDLVGADPAHLALRINAELGRPHINSTGIRALANAVALAEREARRAADPAADPAKT